MARDYARIMTEIWRNPEFCALDASAQRMYLFLVTQPDISAVGLLPLRMRRWAERAADTKPGDVERALQVLDAGRFIVVDFDSEEVLVRAFVRWDGGFTNAKRRPVIVRDGGEVESPRLRAALAAEFRRCGLPPMDGRNGPGGPGGGRRVDVESRAGAPLDDERDGAPRTAPGATPGRASDTAPDRAYAESPAMFDAASSPQVDATSDAPCRRSSDFMGCGYVLELEEPQPTTHNPQPTDSLRSSAAAAAPADHPRAPLALVPDDTTPAAAATPQDVVARWVDAYRAGTGAQPTRHQIGQVGRETRALIEAGNDPARVAAAAHSAATRGFATVTREFTALATRNRPLPGGRPSTTDQRVAAALALADTYPEETA